MADYFDSLESNSYEYENEYDSIQRNKSEFQTGMNMKYVLFSFISDLRNSIQNPATKIIKKVQLQRQPLSLRFFNQRFPKVYQNLMKGDSKGKTHFYVPLL